MSVSKEVGATPQRAERHEVATPSTVAAVARRHDPDRFLFALFAPPERRDALFTLIAFNHELARALDIAAAGRDFATMGGQVRLQFWRDLIETRAGHHELAPAVLALLDDPALDPALLLAMVDARGAELDGLDDATWRDALRDGPGNLARATARLLHVSRQHEDAVADLGVAYALGKILRHRPTVRAAGRRPVPDHLPDEDLLTEARHCLRASGALRVPRTQRTAILPAAIARRDLARAAAGRVQDRPRGLADRLAVLTAALL